MVDIDKKKMIRGYTDYEMKVNEGYLTGIYEVSKTNRIIISLNRYNLELDVNVYKNNSLILDHSYTTTCRKVVKQIWKNLKVTTINSSTVYLATKELT